MMLAYVVLAASLSSESIGTFFTLPSWMPQSNISSHDTPGSDPASGTGGWYVAETTNGVVLANTWKIYDSEETLIEDYENPEYQGGGIWYQTYPPRRVEPQEYEYRRLVPDFIEGDENIESMSWDVEYDEPFAMRSYHAIRDRSIGPVPTGRYVPRSPRLTPDVMAGVYSTFEAYCERQYFALQGQSNVWDTTVYGPRNNTKRFWFDPHTNECEFVWEAFSHTSSNRTVKTRRLVEYGNIDKLAHYMRNKLCGNSFVMFGARRPGWVNACENESLSYYDHGAWWGTTDTSIFSDQRIVPELVWVRDPTYSIRDQWKGCSMCLGNLSSDFNVWEMSQHNVPLYKMMEKLDFGQTDYYPSWCYGGVVTNTVRDQIEASYPHADGWAITNDTRRLYSDRLCCINQVLGLMDRTFHEPEIVYPTTGTNTTYYNELRCRGVSGGTPTFSSDRYVIGSFTPVAWGQDVITNRISESSSQSSGSAYHHRVSKTATNADVEFDFADASVAPSITPEYGIENELVAHAIDLGLYVEGCYVTVIINFERTTQNGILSEVTVDRRNQTLPYDYRRFSWPFDTNITNVSVAAFYSYARQYNYARTTGNLGLGPTQPGYQAGNRFGSAKIGRVIGIHRKSGNVTTALDTMSWTSGSIAEYDSGESSYNSRGGLVEIVRSTIGTAYNRFVNHYGLNPTSWQNIIPINQRDADEVRDSVTINNAELTYEGDCTCEMYGYYTGGIITVSEYGWESRSGHGEGWRPIAVAKLNVTDYTKSQPTQTESDGLATDTKVGAITRVDWNWKTLKRTED